MKPLHGDAEHWFDECARLVGNIAEVEVARDALAQRCRELEKNNTAGVKWLEKSARDLRSEEDDNATLRAEVADLKARLLEAERGAEELVQLQAENREAQIEIERLRTAIGEWLDKTEWVRHEISTGGLPARHLGKHLADVMREEIQRLRNRRIMVPCGEVLDVLRSCRESLEGGLETECDAEASYSKHDRVLIAQIDSILEAAQ